MSKSRFYQLARADRVPALRLGGRIDLDVDALGDLITAATSSVYHEDKQTPAHGCSMKLAHAPTSLDDLYDDVTGKNRKKQGRSPPRPLRHGCSDHRHGSRRVKSVYLHAPPPPDLGHSGE